MGGDRRLEVDPPRHRRGPAGGEGPGGALEQIDAGAGHLGAEHGGVLVEPHQIDFRRGRSREPRGEGQLLVKRQVWIDRDDPDVEVAAFPRLPRGARTEEDGEMQRGAPGEGFTETMCALAASRLEDRPGERGRRTRGWRAMGARFPELDRDDAGLCTQDMPGWMTTHRGRADHGGRSCLHRAPARLVTYAGTGGDDRRIGSRGTPAWVTTITRWAHEGRGHGWQGSSWDLARYVDRAGQDLRMPSRGTSTWMTRVSMFPREGHRHPSRGSLGRLARVTG